MFHHDFHFQHNYLYDIKIYYKQNKSLLQLMYTLTNTVDIHSYYYTHLLVGSSGFCSFRISNNKSSAETFQCKFQSGKQSQCCTIKLVIISSYILTIIFFWFVAKFSLRLVALAVLILALTHNSQLLTSNYVKL